MDDIKLFVSCHKDDVHIPQGNKLLYPIQVGAALAEKRFPGMLHDDVGESISEKNPAYCELTAQYWAWKNVRADYFGFLHYRRYFNFSDKALPIVHEPFVFGEVVKRSNNAAALRDIGFDAATIADVVRRYDFIAPVPVESPTRETVFEQYCASVGHHREDIDTARDIVKEASPELAGAFDDYMNSRGVICCNMFVAKDGLFQEYSAWLFSVLGEFERRRDFTAYDDVERRVVGYVAERLCGVYVTHLQQRGVNMGHLQRVYFRSVSPFKGLPFRAAR